MNAAEKQLSYDELYSEYLKLKQELADLKRLIFGQKRERFIPGQKDHQLSFGLGLEVSAGLEETNEQITYQRKKNKAKYTPHSRQELPAHLPRREIIIEPEEPTEGLNKIGEEITEELDYEPGNLFVNRYIRPKYAKGESEGVIIGDLPSRPIDKGIPGPGLLSHIFISKFVDHLPLYRQRQQFKRQGVDLSASTIDNWVTSGYDLLFPLYEIQRERIIKKEYLMADETPIQVLDKLKKGKTHRGYFWVYHDPLKKEILFDYQNNRSRAGPFQILQDFKGYLQSDGYHVYDEIGQWESITLLGCMAHARRYFDKSLPNDKKRSEEMLTLIQGLYKTESFARDNHFSHEERYNLRQREANPVLNEMKAWLDTTALQVLPKSALGKAIGYMLGRWKYLKRYVEDGRFEIDNNLIENAIRPVALGRKNYLFAGSHNGAKRAALIYTLVANAKLQGLEPFAYMRDLLSQIADYPYKKLADLLPVNWKNQ
ncbi:MAG: IS66 family transposase [Thermodesulfobacteriota bacterium]|nr:IS66 family transposase [Thermodesulfobacteriota bacterium]